MALKDDIFDALITNIQPDNPGENFSITDKGIDKVEILSENLSKAIAKYINDLDFRIVDLKAEGMILPGGINTVGSPAAQANVAPVMLKVQTSKTKNEVGLPQTSANAKVSLVKVDIYSNKSSSGITGSIA